MKSLAIRVGVALGVNAIALLVAAALLDRMSVGTATFVIAVIIFTAISVVAPVLVRAVVHEWVPVLTGAVSLIATFLGLLVTDILSRGLNIEGFGTWILATLIVWAASLGLMAGARALDGRGRQEIES
jgi:hypothetical protein